MKSWIKLIICFIIITSCGNKKNNNIENSLIKAEINSDEIQKVLDHYSQNKADTLKYKAAVFLIENMPIHYSYDFNPKTPWQSLLKKSDSLINANNPDYYEIIQHQFKKIKENTKLEYVLISDMQSFESDELIKHIDLAFEVWPKPWNKQLTFQEFCNYILPYRMKNEPVNFNILEELHINNINRITNNNTQKDIINLSKEFNSLPNNFRYIKLLNSEQSIHDIKQGKMVDCIDYAIYSGMRLRSIGIPTAIDFTIWPNGRGQHYWSATLLNENKILYAEKDFFYGKPGSFDLRKNIAKIYRWNFGKRKDNDLDISNSNSFLTNPNISDVTSQYIKTFNIDIPLQKKPKSNIVYLCIYNDNTWKPIAYSKLKSKTTSFTNIGSGNLYILANISNHETFYLTDVFELNKNGKITYFKPNKEKREEVTLLRKAKFTNRIKEFSDNMIGGTFELSNDSLFNSYTTVCKIDSIITKPTAVKILMDKLYRYGRYRNENKNMVELSEVTWYNDQNIQIKNNIYGLHNKDAKNISDGNFLTYYSSNQKDQLIFDFKTKQHITKVMISPRSDVNFIKPGDFYELLYWEFGWKSIGVKKASDYKIHFNNVPKNAILRLKNLTSGIEEDLFIYYKGKQKFWNADIL